MHTDERGQTTSGVLAIIAGFVVTVVLIAAVTLAGWQIGWWFKNENANREAHLIRNGYSNQQTLREQVTKNIGDVLAIDTQIAQLGTSDPTTKAALSAQRKAIVGMVCQEAEQVSGDPLPSDQSQFVGVNCTAGVISPTSPYNS